MGFQQDRNIIFIVIDTHRRDRLGMYGYGRGTSPNMDSFSQQATIFENAISPAQWTIPAHASMFTGEYTHTHLTTQAGHSLDPYFSTLAELLGEHGYRRVGFCNNPLVGVLDNELKRGFERLYNYGGAIPSTPARASRDLLKPLSKIWERYTQLLRKISYPIQNAFAQSDRMFQLSLNPVFVPLWTKFANFKGNTVRSLQDANEFIRKTIPDGRGGSYFVFLNLMETHLPFTPPQPFINKFAPSFLEERAARDFMRVYNTQALRWLLPMDVPFSELEATTISNLYDAEVAYQDHLLAELLEELEKPYHRDNTMVILVSDHGEMLGEHELMGHSFRVYQELIHVPLVIRFPGQSEGMRIAKNVSTLQIFHTILDFANIPLWSESLNGTESLENRVHQLSLMEHTRDSKKSEQVVFSEAYPPENVLKIMRTNFPDLIKQFSSQDIYRAAYDKDGFKFVRSHGEPKNLFNLNENPDEEASLPTGEYESLRRHLNVSLDRFLEHSAARRPKKWSRRDVNLADDKVNQRLRALGYLE